MATESIALRAQTSRHLKLRRAALVMIGLFALAQLVTWEPLSNPLLIFGLFVNVALAGGASVLSFKASRHFDRGDTGRHVWSLIAFLAMADCGVLISFTLPRIAGTFDAAVTLTLITSTLTALSRGILLPLAMWMMVRVYRGTGLGFHLKRWDYVPMIVLAGLGVLSLALVGSIARSQLYISDPGLTRFLRSIGFLLLPALVLSAVFGVMLWRYTKQMGGGLIARAWQGVLISTVLWLARFALLGILTRWFGVDAIHRPPVIEIISFWAVIASECALFYGASFQYEACSGTMDPNERGIE